MSLHDTFGDIDIYLFDQLLKGRINRRDRILDAGCGAGRNAQYLVRDGYEVWGVDENPRAVEAFQDLAPGRAQTASLDALPFGADAFDVVICSAVLHFARDHGHFEAMVRELFRVLRPGGLLFVRAASRDGLADHVSPDARGRARLPDGSDRYLTHEAQLMHLTEAFGDLLDPLKTTIVHGQRAMTTWVVRKRDGPSGIGKLEAAIVCR